MSPQGAQSSPDSSPSSFETGRDSGEIHRLTEDVYAAYLQAEREPAVTRDGAAGLGAAASRDYDVPATVAHDYQPAATPTAEQLRLGNNIESMRQYLLAKQVNTETLLEQLGEESSMSSHSDYVDTISRPADRGGTSSPESGFELAA